MKFYFWADRDGEGFARLKQSAANNRIVVEPIGLGRMGPAWQHTLFKQEALFDAVSTLPDDEIICATDGFDVFYQRGPDYIRERFTGMNRDVVFAAERGYFHQYKKYRQFYDRNDQPSPYKYLNAGTVVGYAGALRELYRPSRLLRLGVAAALLPHRILARVPQARTVLMGARKRVRQRRQAGSGGSPGASHRSSYARWFSYNDQAIMGKYLAQGVHGLSIDLDRDCALFWCTAFEWNDIDEHCRLIDGRLQNLNTGETPACIHVPALSRHEAVFQRLYEMSNRAR